MTVSYWPLETSSDDGFSMAKRLGSIKKKYPDLYSLFARTVKDLSQEGATVESLGASYSRKLTGHPGISELRIPPERRGGVGRYYYCMHPSKPSAIVILDAEIKTNWRANANKSLLRDCDFRYRTLHSASR